MHQNSKVSPDKQWEFPLDTMLQVVRAGTTQVVSDLLKDLESRGDTPARFRTEEARVIWAPDSKRFAVNYRVLAPEASTYKATAFYQLRSGKLEDSSTT